MRAALITGAAGGIGAALVSAFKSAGYFVVGTDLHAPSSGDADHFIEADLAALVARADALAQFRQTVEAAVAGRKLAVLVNNAAVQILGATAGITAEAWDRTLAVNLTAPLRLVQTFLPALELASGTIINIGSVHAQATKAGFVAYATSKAAIHGLTRALAVDLGPRARVVCVAPAAVATPMLLAGFDAKPDAYAALAAAHPAGRIAEPAEIARAAVAIASDPFLFATGAVFFMDGGVLSRLHDPA